MTKQTKTALMIAGAVGLGYIIWKNMGGKKKNFKDTRNPRFGTPVGPLRPVQSCTSGCVDGRCTIDGYGPTGNIISREYHLCSGSGENIVIGNLINPR